MPILYDSWDMDAISMNIDPNEMKMNPMYGWNLRYASRNARMTLQVIDHFDKIGISNSKFDVNVPVYDDSSYELCDSSLINWNWYYISKFAKLSTDDMKSDRNWNYRIMYNNVGVTIEYVKYALSTFNRGVYSIKLNETLLNSSIYKGIGCSDTISQSGSECFLETFHSGLPIKRKVVPIEWYQLSTTLDVECMLKNLDLPWREDALCFNNTLKLEHIQHFKGITIEQLPYVIVPLDLQNIPCPPGGWDLIYISYNPKLRIDDIKFIQNEITKGVSYKNSLQWDIISRTIPICDVISNLHSFPWSLSGLSHNPSITVKDIICINALNDAYKRNSTNIYTYPIGQFDYEQLSKIVKFNDIIDNVCLFPWSQNGLSHNPGLTVRAIELIDMRRIQHLKRILIPSLKFDYHTDITILCSYT